MAQWIASWTSNPKVVSSILTRGVGGLENSRLAEAWVEAKTLFSIIRKYYHPDPTSCSMGGTPHSQTRRSWKRLPSSSTERSTRPHRRVACCRCCALTKGPFSYDAARMSKNGGPLIWARLLNAWNGGRCRARNCLAPPGIQRATLLQSAHHFLTNIVNSEHLSYKKFWAYGAVGERWAHTSKIEGRTPRERLPSIAKPKFPLGCNGKTQEACSLR